MSDDSLLERVPVATGVAAGAGAYLLGYLVTYLAWRGDVERELQGIEFVLDLLGEEPIGAWRAIGWLFYNAQFVAMQVTPPLGGTRTINVITESDDGTLTLAFLLPPLLLVAAGLVVVAVSDLETDATSTADVTSTDATPTADATPTDGALAGTAVVAGYAPLAIVGLFVFQYGDLIRLDPVTGVLLAGLLYPAVLGAIGGALAIVADADIGS